MRDRITAIVISAFIVLVFAASSSFCQAQQQEKKKLTYEQAYQYAQPHLTGRLTNILGWLDDQHYLEIKGENGKDRKIFKVNAQNGDEETYVDPAEFEDVLPSGFSVLASSEHTDDYSAMIFERNNDIYYLNTGTKVFKQLTATPAEENNPTFSPDGKYVAFTRNHNLFTLQIETGLEYQLTSDGSETIYNGWASWVYYEEILGRRSRYGCFYWSPDSKKLAFLRFDDSVVKEFPIYHADGQYGELEIQRYPKSGCTNPKVKLGIVAATGGDITWADFNENADEYVAWVFWLPDGNSVTTQWMNRAQNHIKIYTINLQSGEKNEIYDETQDAWVEFFEDLYFFEDGSGFLLRSDKDGWSHLYVYGMDGTLKKRLTEGEWGVSDIALVDEKNGFVYFSGDKDESTQTHLYQVKLSGGGLKQLTSESGSHRVQVSPDGTYFIDTYSNITKPAKMTLKNNDGKLLRELGDSYLPIMDEYDLGKVELFRIPTTDGYNMPAIWYLPPDFDESKKYPVLFTIYGGPGSASVANRFPYFGVRSYYMAQQGIIVISVDHRGSGHFGKKGMAEMYRNLGKWETHDWIEAVKWLREKPFVDAERIGITGGSYGGYMTLMALTKGADYFTHGIAISPVTDWKLYDTVYTERYMDRPQDNPEGYKAGSVLTYADNLKGKLLLVHGTIDDNVHTQNTIQLVDQLTLMKKDFELMLYPDERHGIYIHRDHLNMIMDEFLRKELLGE